VAIKEQYLPDVETILSYRYDNGAIYPCHTAYAAYLLCSMGYASDIRIQATFRHLLDTQSTDGGWRCNKFSFGRGPETEMLILIKRKTKKIFFALFFHLFQAARL